MDGSGGKYIRVNQEVKNEETERVRGPLSSAPSSSEVTSFNLLGDSILSELSRWISMGSDVFRGDGINVLALSRVVLCSGSIKARL